MTTENTPDWAKNKEALSAGEFHKFINAGDSIAGRVIAVTSGTFKGKENHLVRMQTKDGIKVVAGTEQLLRYIHDHKLVNKVVGILYRGKETTKGGFEFKKFDVFALTPEEAGITLPAEGDDDDLPF